MEIQENWSITGRGAWKKLILEIFIVRQDLIEKAFLD
jgi:hypothetical protein